MKKGEICPADIILLNSGILQELDLQSACSFDRKENVCYIDTREIDGSMKATLKKSTKLAKCKPRLNRFSKLKYSMLRQ